MLICNAVLTDADGARPGDVRIENGVITAVGEGLSTGGDTVLDAGGRTLLPAFIDLHCHFRTPGFEYKEDIDSGSRAAARGGYTFVNCMANTRPVCSSAAIAQSIMDDARRIGLCDGTSVCPSRKTSTARPPAICGRCRGTSASSARTAKACARAG